MAKQYWVGEFYVDLSRNQISQRGEPQTLPPKALSVLTYLAEHKGRVVGYDELLDAVWPDSVVTPNTLQRSIAQLRKALGENSQAQSLIKTHAKQGYSLESEVRWSDVEQASTQEVEPAVESAPQEGQASVEVQKQHAEPAPVEAPHQSEAKTKNNGFLPWMLAAAIVLVALFLVPQYQSAPSQLTFSDLRYLTATDDKEYGGSYTPDGKYIVFRRYYDRVCINNLWAKDAQTHEEVMLTSERGTYGNHSLSEDGKNLVFIKEEDCDKPITQNTCYTLMGLNFNQALLEPQSPKPLLHCQNSAIKNPTWVGKEHIVMMQKKDQHWRLLRFSAEDQSSTDFYTPQDGNIIGFAYSSDLELIAVSSRKSDGEQYIEILSKEGELKSSHVIQFPDSAPRHLTANPVFLPNSNKLIFGDGSDFYTLSYEGEVKLENTQLVNRAGGLSFHPEGDRVLLITGRYDSDIASMPVPGANDDGRDHPSELSVFERSTVTERFGKFQPNGSLIAYSSWRTGSEQVWLYDGESSTLLSDLPMNGFIDEIHWSQDGQSMLVLVYREMHLLSLNRESRLLPFPHRVIDMYHWDSESELAIARIQVNGVLKFVEIDLSTMDYREINPNRVQWAAKSGAGTLVFMDHLDRFWRQGEVEDQLIEALQGQAWDKGFLVKGNKIYSLNRDFEFWSYDLETDRFEVLGTLPEDVIKLTDIRDNQLLVTVLIAEKKEVIEVAVDY